jgi:phosphinothricin acetyltransferase
MQLRDVTPADAPPIAAIYGHHVRTGLASFEEIAPDATEIARRIATTVEAGYPYIVAIDDRDEIVGYAYAGPYRPRNAYRFTIENSVYVREDQHGKGIGTTLLRELIDRCESGPWRQMIAVIGNSENHASIGLHRRFGFEHVGILRNVGFKHGRWVDTVLMQRELGTRETGDL